MDLGGELHLPHPIERLSGEDLRTFLNGPLPAADIATIARAWHWATISILLSGDFRGLSGHDLARKTRGAIWPLLVEHASATARDGRPCPNRPLCLLDLLWNDHGFITRAREIPKPFVLRGHVDTASGARRGFVQMVLFGLATAYTGKIQDLLLDAFAVGVGGRGRWRVMASECVEEIDAGIAPIDAEVAVMDLLSPLKLGRDGQPAGDWRGLVAGLVDRVEGLARWHGLTLDCDFGRLKAIARSIEVHDEAIEPTVWQRKSQRSRNPIPMVDLRGHLVLEGDLGPLAPFLVVGETTHAGKDTRHGHGWYRLGFLSR
jgi:hypothetical protein